ncbi:MAG: GAF domain-containing protein [Candidatus Riflebacteria bacterium]|nr:GAF domain-containing protein [Candidatus Riflebacteria bacterium]
MKKPTPSLDQILTAKDRREIADLIRNSFSLTCRFIAGVELDSLRQTYVLPCPIKSAIGCIETPCTRTAVTLDGRSHLTECVAGFSWGLVPVLVGGNLIAYVQLGPFFTTRSQREALFGRRPELRPNEPCYPLLAGAQNGALTMVGEWLNTMIRSRLDQQALAQKETLLLFLVDSTKSIASMGDPEELLTFLTDASISLTEAHTGFILRLDEARNELRIATARGVATDFNKNHRVPVGTGITGWVGQHGKPAYVPDTSKDHRYVAVGYHAASELAVPIKAAGRLVGVLAVDSMEKNAFSEFDRQLLESLASQVALVTDAVREEKEGKVKLKQLEALHTVSSAVNSTLELAEVLHAVLRTLSHVFSASGCAILLSDGDRAELMVKVADEEQIKTVRNIRIDGDKGILGYMLRERRPVLLHEDAGELFARFRDFISSDISSIICAPLINKREIMGTLVAMGAPPVRYSKGDLDLLTTVAGQVSQALSKAKLFERSQRQVAELSLINELGKAINSSLDLDNVLDYIINMLSSILEADSGSLMLLSKDRETLGVVCSKGLDPQLVSQIRLKVGEGIAGWVAQHEKPLLLGDASQDPRYVELDMPRHHFSMISVPIVNKDSVIGVLNFERSLDRKHPFTEDDLVLLSTLGGQAAMAVENASLYRNLIQVHFETIQSLAHALEAKDQYTHGHSRRVSKDAVRIAQRLGLQPKSIEIIRHAALLHDIGKIGVRDSVLLKPGKLSDDELGQIRRHSVLGHTILNNVEHLRAVAEIVRHHHERIDGKGYPDHLKGQEIPLGSRIICISDCFDAMITTRPYREGLSIDAAVRELILNKGAQFDPQLVDIFVEIIKEHHPALAPLLEEAVASGGRQAA